MFQFIRNLFGARAVKAPRVRSETRKPLSDFERKFLKFQLSGKLRMRIYEKLGKFVANGVPVTQALDEIYNHMSLEGKKPKAVAAMVIDEWRRGVRNGRSFARAIQGWAPTGEVSVLDAGEVSGRLDRAIEDVLFVYSASKRIRSALFGLVYPIVLLGTTCLYLYIFGTKVVPAFQEVLPVAQWEGAGKQMAALAQFVRVGLLPTLVGVGAVVVLIVASFGRWTGKIRQKFDKFPPWTLYRLTVGSSFLISLGALLHAGVSVPEALRVIHATASPWYRERLVATRQQVLNGARNIGDALHKTGFEFPSAEIVMDIRSYAALDGFEDMLDKLSRQWLDESVKMIQGQMDVLRNASIIIMALIFMWIANGMFALQQQISQAASFG
jgi:type II secretory pathway component PulF